MDLIASLVSQKINTFNFFKIKGILSDRDLSFLFDSGAVCPVIGINNFFHNDDSHQIKNKDALCHLLHNEMKTQCITPRPQALTTANKQNVVTYPCVCHKVSIANSEKITFYFDICFDDINIPLLGSSFIDDCSYIHPINGNVSINSIKVTAGSGYYKELNVLNFDIVSTKYSDLKLLS